MRFEIARNFPWRWAMWWILVPNLAFIAMWPIGGPAMAGPMFLSGVLAVLFSNASRRLTKAAVALTIFAFNMLAYLALSFNLGLSTMLDSVRFLPDLNPMKSPEYLLAGLLLFATLAGLLARAPRTPTLRTRDHKFVALGLVALLVNVDGMATAGTRGSYKMSAPSDARIDSAILQNHITPAAIKGDKDLVVIMVESWGSPAAPEDRALFDKLWNPARWEARYDVKRGSSAYFGSTTNAELREWCGVWADHKSYDFDRADCVPDDFRDAGFQTIALHSFEGEFFDRNQWYPKIGFEQTLFSDDLQRMGADACGGVFPGACDRDVPEVIGNLLRENLEERDLVYWLTVNGHLPLPSDDSLDTDRCTLGTPEWREDFSMLCRTYEVQRQIADSVTAEIMRPDFPDADILIVGDHMPPFFPRHVRSRFDTTRVPWIMLRNRSDDL